MVQLGVEGIFGRKQKVKLTHQVKKELLEAFESEQEECKNLVFEIEKAEQTLDKMFLEMYQIEA